MAVAHVQQSWHNRRTCVLIADICTRLTGVRLRPEQVQPERGVRDHRGEHQVPGQVDRARGRARASVLDQVRRLVLRRRHLRGAHSISHYSYITILVLYLYCTSRVIRVQVLLYSPSLSLLYSTLRQWYSTFF